MFYIFPHVHLMCTWLYCERLAHSGTEHLSRLIQQYQSRNHPAEVIIQEHGLWPEKGMNAQCNGFKCVAGKTDCCCRRLCGPEVSFGGVNHLMQSHLWILPKIPLWAQFHWAILGGCKTLLLEQPKNYRYQWNGGQHESLSWQYPTYSDSKVCYYTIFYFNFANFSPILRYTNQLARFIDAYAQGATGPIAVWANRKYHGHRTLPPEIFNKLKDEFYKRYRQESQD